MFDVGWSEIIVVILISSFVLDIKDIKEIIKTTKLIFSQLTKVKSELINTVKDIENSVTELDEEGKIIDFEEFSKEFLEPIEDHKLEDQEYKRGK